MQESNAGAPVGVTGQELEGSMPSGTGRKLPTPWRAGTIALGRDCELNVDVPMPRGTRERLGFQLVMVGELLGAIADELLSDSGVDARSYCLLATLSVDAPDSQHELARLLGKAPGVIVAEVDQMERKGFVERRRDPNDRRRSRVTLTPAGEAALAHADELADTAIAELLGGLDAGELAQLQALLNKGLSVHEEPAQPEASTPESH